MRSVNDSISGTAICDGMFHGELSRTWVIVLKMFIRKRGGATTEHYKDYICCAIRGLMYTL